VRAADEDRECRVDRGEERFDIRREIVDDIDEDTGVLEHGVVRLGLFLVRRQQRGRLCCVSVSNSLG
jgi:hypothetical protein